MSLARNEVCGRLSIIKFKLSSSLVIKSIALKCLAWIAWFCAIFALKLRGFCFAGFDFSHLGLKSLAFPVNQALFLGKRSELPGHMGFFFGCFGDWRRFNRR